MRRCSWVLLRLIFFCIILIRGADSAQTLSFSGRVDSGQNFSRRMTDDLWFCLFAEPGANGGGWWIAVQRSCSAHRHDFVAVATPPMHGPNAREIAAWHFEPGADAPQKVRDFAFVLNDADWRHLMKELNSYKDAAKMLGQIENLGRGHGTLTITGMHRHLKNGAPSFDWMQFRVVLQWPEK
jgi:hypothetical protein